MSEKPFRPMLAASTVNMEDLVFPLIGSPKLDGIRALVRGGKLVTRKLLAVPNHHIQNALGHKVFEGLDGELVAGLSYGKGVFNRTSSAIMSREGQPPVTYHVFDNWEMGQDAYVTRMMSLPGSKDLFETKDGKGYVRIRKLTHKVLESPEDVLQYEAAMLLKGYEGIMLRHPKGLYKYGRSTLKEGWLIKVKRFEDGEAVVYGIIEQRYNGNEATINDLGLAKRTSHKANKVGKGTTGALQVRDMITGVEFEIGTGMDDETRIRFWSHPPIGKVVKYKSQPVGVLNKPRFPVFLGIRED